MNRHDYVLAVLSAGGERASYSPVKVQKLFFLIDREIPQWVGGPHFQFEPYDYGPFDKAVYGELDLLRLGGLIEDHDGGRYRCYELTPEGYDRGQSMLASFTPEVRDYISAVAAWVRSLSFAQLVSAIYQRYPDMKANSIFQQ